MTHPVLFIRALLIAVLLFLGLMCSCAPREMAPLSIVEGNNGLPTEQAGSGTRNITGRVDSALVIPDGTGVISLAGTQDRRDSGYMDARELKLKLRELGEQLAAGIDDCSLQGTVALPASFVNLDDFNRSSPLGRLMAEQLFYELNQRGYPVREYRLPKSIQLKKRQGEFALTRAIGKTPLSAGSVAVVGTYQADRDAVFVNARLVRPKDGRVLRTANIVLAANPLTRRMLGNSPSRAIPDGTMTIRDFAGATSPAKPKPQNLTPFDRGEDIH
jgi:hypothetical protein